MNRMSYEYPIGDLRISTITSMLQINASYTPISFNSLFQFVNVTDPSEEGITLMKLYHYVHIPTTKNTKESATASSTNDMDYVTKIVRCTKNSKGISYEHVHDCFHNQITLEVRFWETVENKTTQTSRIQLSVANIFLYENGKLKVAGITQETSADKLCHVLERHLLRDHNFYKQKYLEMQHKNDTQFIEEFNFMPNFVPNIVGPIENFPFLASRTSETTCTDSGKSSSNNKEEYELKIIEELIVPENKKNKLKKNTSKASEKSIDKERSVETKEIQPTRETPQIMTPSIETKPITTTTEPIKTKETIERKNSLPEVVRQFTIVLKRNNILETMKLAAEYFIKNKYLENMSKRKASKTHLKMSTALQQVTETEFPTTEISLSRSITEAAMYNTDFSVLFLINREKLHNLLYTHTELTRIFPQKQFDPERYPGIILKYIWNDIYRGENGMNPFSFSNLSQICEGKCHCAKKCTKKGTGCGINSCRFITISIFQTGKIIMTGATAHVQIVYLHRAINLLLHELRAEIEMIKPKLVIGEDVMKI